MSDPVTLSVLLSQVSVSQVQVSVPQVDDSLVRLFLRFIGLLVGGFLTSALAALGYRWFTKEVIPQALAVLFGSAIVALYLNTVGLFADVLGEAASPVFEPEAVLFNAGVLIGAALISPVGRLVGDRIATDVFAVAGAKELDAEVSRLVRTVGRVTSLTLPDEIEDIEAYDPVSESVKAQLAGKTLLFPRRLTQDDLRDRLAARLKEDHGVGHVDVEFDDDDRVSYLALGSRVAGIGVTLAPGTVAVPIHGDPGPGATAGDPVQVWSIPKTTTSTDGGESEVQQSVASNGNTETTGQDEETTEKPPTPQSPKRVAFGELRGIANDTATIALDADDAAALSADETYRLVTLPSEPHIDREFASLLRNADETMGVITVAEGAELDGRPVSDVGATVVAIRAAHNPVDAIPSHARQLDAGDVLYVVARPEVLRKVEQRATMAETDGGDESGGDGDGLEWTALSEDELDAGAQSS
ncbi:TrkA C-terminal domain-containing protein [Haloferax sp. DFSO60]|uniref:TrkA C-terminal domain-containing protein n=1 Tax=Haloferax sp. DFSO60 TaxID=3388652 RepID=UPI0039795271